MPEEQKPSMSKAKKDSLIARLKMDIDAANNYYEETVEPAVMERYDIYGAKKSFYRKMFPNLSKRCEIVSTDIQDVIESTMPSMMKAFFGSTDVVTVQGMDGTDEDEQRAEKMQALINYQLEKEQFFMTFYQWAKDALITNLGIIKVDWERLIEQEQQEITLDPQAFEQMMTTAEQNNVQILSVDPVPEWGGYHVVYMAPMMKKNQPRIMNVLASEFRFSPDATSLETADFIAHRKIVTLDYLRKQEESGWYEHVEEVAQRAQEPHYTPLDEQNNENIDEEPNTADSGRQKVELYECYVNINMSENPDEKLTPMIITYSNGVILRMEENTYERHPFFCLSPRIDPHKIWPDSGFVDLIAQIQHAKTAILRQMIYSMAQSNDGKMGINLATLVDVNDVLENRQFVRVNGDVKEALMPIPMAPLQQWTFQMLEYLDNVKENRTGITRYNQGMDNNSLNKMLDIYTLVPMADGFYKILKDIVDGDRIIGRDGKPVTVLKAHKIHYPERAYNITFQSGETICAGGEHLWTVKTQIGRWKVMDTDSMYDFMQKHKANMYIPRVGRVDFEGGEELPLDPYLLGLYLGDGNRHSCRITIEDEEILDYVKSWAEENGCEVKPCKTGQNAGNATTYTITGGLWSILHDLHIVRRTPDERAEKYIPEEYFHASYEDRLSLLKGLMDTDGCHHSGALCIFTQKEGQLLNDVYRLVASLGCNPSLHVTCPGDLAKDGATYYNLHFSANDCPFGIRRKAEGWRPRERCRDYQRIMSIEPARMCLMRCLTVDAEDGLFCVGERFTVTHNTATGINLILQQSNQRIELIARIFAETGLRELFKFLIKMNQLFINQETVIRLTNGPMVIKPDDLEGDFDLIVNAGMGAGQKQQNVQNMQVLQGLMTQLAQIGMVGNEEIYNFSKKYIEELGFKNVDDFVMPPDKAAQYQQMMAQQQQASQQAQESESVRAAITDAPWEVQMQFWQKKGFEATPDMFTNQAMQRVLETATQEEAKSDVHRGERLEQGFAGGASAAGGARPQGGGNPGAAAGVSGGNQGESRGRVRPQQPPRPASGDGAGTFSGLLGGR